MYLHNSINNNDHQQQHGTWNRTIKDRVENIDFFSRAIDTEASLPFDQAWSGASKKVHVLQSIDQGPEKCESEGAF